MLTRTTFTAAVLVLAAGAAVATGAIPSGSDGVIHACHEKAGLLTDQGDLRVIDKESGQSCRNNEIPLSWNQRGPQGATGPQGPQGAPGPPGPPGFTEALSTSELGPVPLANILDGPTTVVSETLPEGEYVITATLVLENPDVNDIDHAGCRLMSRNIREQSSSPWLLNDRGDSGDKATIALQGTVGWADSFPVRVECFGVGASTLTQGDVAARDASLIATRVGSIG
jgi:hypothetical protein